jgi:hypothetical protein
MAASSASVRDFVGALLAMEVFAALGCVGAVIVWA